MVEIRRGVTGSKVKKERWRRMEVEGGNERKGRGFWEKLEEGKPIGIEEVEEEDKSGCSEFLIGFG